MPSSSLSTFNERRPSSGDGEERAGEAEMHARGIAVLPRSTRAAFWQVIGRPVMQASGRVNHRLAAAQDPHAGCAWRAPDGLRQGRGTCVGEAADPAAQRLGGRLACAIGDEIGIDPASLDRPDLADASVINGNRRQNPATRPSQRGAR